MRKHLLLLVLCLSLAECSVANKIGGLSQAKKLHTTGIQAEAKILEITDTGWTLNDDPVISFMLEVYQEGNEPYRAKTRIVISRVHVPQFQPGVVVPVRIDPANPHNVSLDIYDF